MYPSYAVDESGTEYRRRREGEAFHMDVGGLPALGGRAMMGQVMIIIMITECKSSR